MYKLKQGNCLELMPQIPSGSVDMILCDLPYGTTACKWDTVIPFEPLWAEYKRIIKKNGAIVLFGSQPFTSALVMSNPDWFKYIWTWKKLGKPTGFQNAKKQPLRCIEDICVFGEGQIFYYPQGLTRIDRKKKNSVSCGGDSVRIDVEESTNKGSMRTPGKEYVQEFTGYPTNLLEFDRVHSGTEHPTQKPVALCEYLIKTYTNEGEWVLDNCMGSGTTGVAAVNTGRNFIGIEQEEKYFTIAKQRIQQAEQLLTKP